MPSFQTLPQEIREGIVELAVKQSPATAAGLACVSLEWQARVERQTFHKLKVDQSRLDGLRDIVTPVRRAYVRRVEMDALLPEYNAHQLWDEEETAEEQRRNNEALTGAVQGVLSVLSSWEKPVRDGEGVSLVLRAYSPSDVAREPGLEFRHRLRRQRWCKSYLDLTDEAHDHLPQVPVLTAFAYETRVRDRDLVPRVCCDIASRAPHLRRAAWALNDDDKGNPRRRRQMRQDLAAGLGRLPGSLRQFSLAFPNAGPANQAVEPRAYDSDNATLDPLSVALRTLSQRLETIAVDGCVVLGSECLWPDDEITLAPPSGPDSSAAPSWPQLEHLSITVSMISPSGAWLFDHDPRRPRAPPPASMDPDVRYKIRSHPVPELINKYFLAAAGAAARMPRLASLGIRWESPGACILQYNVLAGGSRAELIFCRSFGVDLADEVRDAWRAASRVQIGTDAELDIVVEDQEDRAFQCDCQPCIDDEVGGWKPR